MKTITILIYSFSLILFSSCKDMDSLIFTPSDQIFEKCQLGQKLGFSAISLKNLRYYVKKKEDSKGIVIFFHGSGRSACENLEIVPIFKNIPIDLFIMEYPGFSGDINVPEEISLLKSSSQLMEKIKEENKHNLPIIVYGASLGSTIATKVAGKFKTKGLILRAAPESILAVAQTRYPAIPNIKRLFKSHFRADLWARKVHGDVLMLHGDRDKQIPLEMGLKQKENFINSRNLLFKRIKGAGHMNMFKFELYKSSIRNFVHSLI